MEFRIWVETRLDGRILERELVSSVERPASEIGPEEIGLNLVEGKAMLRKVQARIVQTQVDVLSAAHRRCFRCGRNQRVKDLRKRRARTVFGTVEVWGLGMNGTVNRLKARWCGSDKRNGSISV